MRTELSETRALVVLVADGREASGTDEAQPASPAANNAMQATPVRSPKEAMPVEMTSIVVVMGNYPLVTPRAPLRFETIVSEDAFARLAGEWDPLVRAMPRPSPFMLHCWLVEWWRHYGEGCRLSV